MVLVISAMRGCLWLPACSSTPWTDRDDEMECGGMPTTPRGPPPFSSSTSTAPSSFPSLRLKRHSGGRMIAEQSGAPCSHVVSARHTALGFSHAPTNPHDFRRNLLTYIATDDDYIGADQPDMQLPIPADVCVTSVIFPAHARRMPVTLRPFATSRFLCNIKKKDFCVPTKCHCSCATHSPGFQPSHAPLSLPPMSHHCFVGLFGGP
ncbi:hypothetical protein BKA56DRAFT_275289 [Ilyonectria sp. MPI-CAGE-AT-0026]|nr:hypothetical protein BKA56DRAFT_275289 [Ilyonectria sp. MPI-CAGE-AT-0026]